MGLDRNDYRTAFQYITPELSIAPYAADQHGFNP